MASNQPVAPPAKPLSFMQSLNSVVAYFEPPASSAAGPGNDPELIVVLGWMAARDLHLAKYIAQHRALFPASRLLLVRYPLAHIVNEARGYREVAPAVPIISALAEGADAAAGGGRPRVLFHVFSNGGMSNAAKLHVLLRRQHGGALVLPRHVTVFDSCPGYFRWQLAHRAIAQPLPWWASPLVHVVLAVMWAWFNALGRAPPPDENADALVHPDGVRSEARRAYLYGDGDDMVDWRDVEKHAALARQAGFDVARLELFEGGRHVAHVRVDSDRYWGAVKAVWEGE
ncbi:hypothetical protein S7711_02562 [Stachybotrys chartarum IBT 7711]|uniref:Indole-diterpene biosynthesis protein PaxU n=1 Tax=Stachybotrys chartarum (strain CBS 109288 / IBT 7711) TaxID=1280523 RepID=A0A084B5F1_STACB|nr:hypothetical protein S7711_02562 [Stachybotrys chartarum IBT 7711]KFA50494.1 hypothetical protein S40293_03041 [Stachybotrys chartarum IBT 40293]